MTARRTPGAPIVLPKVHAATKLTTQVRIPPSAPQASHCADSGVPRTPGAEEGHPLPRRLTRPRRPLPLYGTFSTEDWALAVAKEAERHAAEVADGAAGWLDLCGCAGHRGQRPPDKCPLNRVVKFKRRPERRCVGRLSGFGLQYALMHVEMSIASGGISIHDLEYSPMLSRSCRRLPCSLFHHFSRESDRRIFTRRVLTDSDRRGTQII
jgi:hypothetical protein